MRERIAALVVGLTMALLVALAAAFAERQNAPGETTARTGGEPEGRAVFLVRGCARCHSVAGVGSARSPLDGVGGRLDRSALRDRVLGLGAGADGLPPSVVRAKARYRELPDEDLAALLDWLAALDAP